MLSCFVLTTAAANRGTLAVTCSMLIITKMERSDHCETSRSNDNRKEFSNRSRLWTSLVFCFFPASKSGWGLSFSNAFAIF